MYSNSGLCQRLTNFHFTVLCHFEGSSLVFNRAPGFCTSDDSFYFPLCHQSLQVKPPLWTVRTLLHPHFSALHKRWGGSAIARCGNGRCEGLSWFLSSSPLSSSSSPPPSGSSGKPRQCEAPKADETGRDRQTDFHRGYVRDNVILGTFSENSVCFYCSPMWRCNQWGH